MSGISLCSDSLIVSKMFWHAIVLIVCSLSSVPQAENTAHTEGM